MKAQFAILICLFLFSCSSKEKEESVPIQWVDILDGDYTFTSLWSYSESLSDDMPEDTTKYYYTIACEANCYEWDGNDYIDVERISPDTVVCNTINTVSTHSSLNIVLSGDKCTPIIYLTSIASEADKIFTVDDGSIKIDKQLWKKDTLKAEFDFTFNNPDDPSYPIWWKGRIYSHIKN